MPLPLGITLGDPNGVGPELVLRCFATGKLPRGAVVFGDQTVLRDAMRRLRVSVPLAVVPTPAAASQLAPEVLPLIDLGSWSADQVQPGQIAREAGAAALAYVAAATDQTRAGKLAAMVTLPINKEAVRLSEPDFSGHTGYIAARCGVQRYALMLYAAQLSVTHLSTHVSLQDAITAVTRRRVLQTIQLTHEALQRLCPRPRLAVAGLNPHAGEHGAFGSQDDLEVAPAVQEARALGIQVEGPIPPDSVFCRAALDDEFDAVVCMYHDQGHIPFKLLCRHSGVNVTLGLPIIRTSVDHGTAFDIAYQGIADTGGLVAACGHALRLVEAGPPATPSA